MKKENDWIFKGINYNLQDIKQAFKDLDNNKYDDYTTDEQGDVYNFISPKEKLYGVKRVFECISKNKGGIVSVNDFGSYESLREKVEKAGFKMIKKNNSNEPQIQIPFQTQYQYYMVHQELVRLIIQLLKQ